MNNIKQIESTRENLALLKELVEAYDTKCMAVKKQNYQLAGDSRTVERALLDHFGFDKYYDALVHIKRIETHLDRNRKINNLLDE